MLASLSFDPKLTWDSKEEQALAEGREVPQEPHGNRDEKPA